MITSFEFDRREVRYRGDGPAGVDVGSPASDDTLLLVPGLGGTLAFWNTVWPLLGARHRLISFDHPGMGGSADPRESPSVAQLARLSIALLDHVGVDRAVIVGHSMGGAVAQTLAIEQPDRVRAVVLSSTWARPDHYFRKAFAQRKMLLEQCGAGAYARAQTLSVFPPAWIAANPQAADAQEKRAAQNFRDPTVLSQRIDAVLAFDRSAELDQLACSALVVYCRDDTVVPAHMSIDLAQRLPNASILELSGDGQFGGGHFAPVIRSEAFADGLLAFTNTLSS